MERPSPESHDLACQLLAHEMQGPSLEGRTPTETAEAGQRICQKLYQQMAQLIGPTGFNALGARALHLARIEFPFLNGVEIRMQEEGCLKGLPESVQGQPPAEISSALVAVFANFIWLLVTFIGKDLALRQLRSIWPEISPCGADADAKEEKG